MVEPLFTVADLLGQARDADMLPENLPQVRAKARASGIANCARQIAYYMTNTPGTNPGREDSSVTTAQGRIMEDLSIDLIERTGKAKVVNRQIELPPDYPLTGHPDGELLVPHLELSDRDVDPEIVWRNYDSEGLVRGFEHKHLGRWAYEATFKKGIERAEPGYLAQAIAYADALGWDVVDWVIMAQDASSTNSDATANLRAKKPEVRWAVREDWNPKYQTYTMDMRPYLDTLAKRIRHRAEWFMKFAADIEPLAEVPEDLGLFADSVMREYDAESLSKSTYYVDPYGDVQRSEGPPFPCSHCEWLTRCLEVGQGTIAAPELPLKVGDEPIGMGE